MKPHPLAGKQPPRSMLVNVPRLITAYYTERPDPHDPSQRVVFGTSGHRGSAFGRSFTEAHVLAITQAICDYRTCRGVTGPIFLGMDTHALSEPSHASTLEVLAANGVDVMIQDGGGYTPTPVISQAILSYNRCRKTGVADGIVITPSHNPPEDGGFKYNPPEGGPADVGVTRSIQERANELLQASLNGIRRVPYERALRSSTTHPYDYVTPYVTDLEDIIELPAVRSSGVRIGVDPLGGASLAYWERIAERFGLCLEVANRIIDPTFAFMPCDWDGKIRMDCSSPFAMAGLIGLKDNYDIAFGNDPDGDRHGIVTRGEGLMNPNHYLAVAIWYLFSNRPGWRRDAAVGKTAVSSSLIDRVACGLGKELTEVPVGFKWFVSGLLDGSFGVCGEESAGASFLRKDGTVWATDKDGIIMNLLAAEITAVTGKDPADQLTQLTGRFGIPWYERIDVPASAAQKTVLKSISPDAITATVLAGETIRAVVTHAPGNGAPLDGLKVVAENGWFAARPSGTEDVYKIYTESFSGREHLERIQREARDMIDEIFCRAGLL